MCDLRRRAGVVGKDREVCAACKGQRWNADALSVRVGERTIADWSATPIAELLPFVAALSSPHPPPPFSPGVPGERGVGSDAARPDRHAASASSLRSILAI